MMSFAIGTRRTSEPARMAARAARGSAGFNMASSQPAAENSLSDATELSGSLTGAAQLGGLLALQEQQPALEPEHRERDRRARRQGHAMLAALTDLQRCLTVGDPSAALDRLVGLVRTMPLAADPVLASLLAAIALRARVEIARRSPENGTGAPAWPTSS